MSLIKYKNHQIGNIEVSLLLIALKERYGFDFTGYARASMKRRLAGLAQYFDVTHLSELIPIMLYDEAVALTLINRISVPASEFFRDPDVWRRVREKMLPQLASFPHINIWQAGCAQGEETYTLAILLHEAGLAKKMRIFATDINPDFLEHARIGTWSRRGFDTWRENYRKAGGSGDFDRYFVTHGDEVTICDELKQSIEFLQHNLVTDDVFKEVQWAVCRNVLIYFGDELQRRVLKLLSRSVERGGFLLLGQSERILDLPEMYPELEAFDEAAQLYRKTIGKFRGTAHV